MRALAPPERAIMVSETGRDAARRGEGMFIREYVFALLGTAIPRGIDPDWGWIGEHVRRDYAEALRDYAMALEEGW